MKYSKYVFFYTINDHYVGIYHSLLVQVVYLSNKEKEQVDYCLETQSYSKTNVENIIEYMLSNHFLVQSENDDCNLLQQCIGKINMIQPSIANVYLIVTEECNFRCKYCFISDAVKSNRKTKNMSNYVVEASVKLLQKIYEDSATEFDKSITFYGGEPLLNFGAIKRFFEIVSVEAIMSRWPTNINYSIITNGSLLDKEHISFCKENNIKLCISYDVDRRTHSTRISKNGECTYDIVRRNIELCNMEKIDIGLSVTISEDTIRCKDQIINEIVEINPVSLGFNLLLPNNGIVPSNTYYEEATNFMISCFMVFREKGIYEDRIMRKVNAFTNRILYPYDCCACGANQLVLAPDGQVGICHGFLNDRKYFSGNVFDESFDFKSNPDYFLWKNRSPLFMPECQGCDCLGICGGGCAYAAHYKHGSINELDERFCIQSKTILKWLINEVYDKTKMSMTK